MEKLNKKRIEDKNNNLNIIGSLEENGELASPKSKRPEKLRFKLIQRMLKSRPSYLDDCEFRPVKNLDEFQSCSRLVYREYLSRNFTVPHEGQLRLSIHQATLKSTTIIALYKKKFLLGTVTLVEDSPLGLPMDKIYRQELDQRRDVKMKMCEATMLAQNKELLNNPDFPFPDSGKIIILLHMFQAGLKHLRETSDIDTLVACFNPRHKGFYEAIGFEPMAGLKFPHSVQGAPALAYSWDLKKLEEGAEGTLRLFFGFDVSAEYIRKRRSNKFKFTFLEFMNTFIHLPPSE